MERIDDDVREPFLRLVRSQRVPLPAHEAFSFFSDVRNLEVITPPWLGFRVVSAPPMLEEGALIEYELSIRRVPVSWCTRIVDWQPGGRFVDVQLRGPYAHWEHTHEFEPLDGGTLITDVVRYRLPLGPLGRLVHELIVRRDLDRIFDYRREAVARLLGQPVQ